MKDVRIKVDLVGLAFPGRVIHEGHDLPGREVLFLVYLWDQPKIFTWLLSDGEKFWGVEHEEGQDWQGEEFVPEQREAILAAIRRFSSEVVG